MEHAGIAHGTTVWTICPILPATFTAGTGLLTAAENGWEIH